MLNFVLILYFKGSARLSQLENNVLDVVGRESARIQALPIPDMAIRLGPPTSAGEAPSTVPLSTIFDDQFPDATIIIVDETTSGKLIKISISMCNGLPN